MNDSKENHFCAALEKAIDYLECLGVSPFYLPSSLFSDKSTRIYIKVHFQNSKNNDHFA